jgi:hypothetical protein
MIDVLAVQPTFPLAQGIAGGFARILEFPLGARPAPPPFQRTSSDRSHLACARMRRGPQGRMKTRSGNSLFPDQEIYLRYPRHPLGHAGEDGRLGRAKRMCRMDEECFVVGGCSESKNAGPLPISVSILGYGDCGLWGQSASQPVLLFSTTQPHRH